MWVSKCLHVAVPAWALRTIPRSRAVSQGLGFEAGRLRLWPRTAQGSLWAKCAAVMQILRLARWTGYLRAEHIHSALRQRIACRDAAVNSGSLPFPSRTPPALSETLKDRRERLGKFQAVRPIPFHLVTRTGNNSRSVLFPPLRMQEKFFCRAELSSRACE